MKILVEYSSGKWIFMVGRNTFLNIFSSTNINVFLSPKDIEDVMYQDWFIHNFCSLEYWKKPERTAFINIINSHKASIHSNVLSWSGNVDFLQIPPYTGGIEAIKNDR